MNIETLLQAAKILESQQPGPPKKQIALGEHLPTASPVSNNVLSSNVTNATQPIVTSIIKTEPSASDLNLNVNHYNHQNNDFDDDDNDDDQDQCSKGNSETHNRTQTSCLRDREIHNRLEKHRRAHLKDCFDNLKAEVPCQRDRKITNLQVLNFAIKYIQTLTRRERTYERELAILNSQNVELQQRLKSLKTELNSQGHDVDTWLSSCTDVDRSLSTETASEAEMYRNVDDEPQEQSQNYSAVLPVCKMMTDNHHIPEHEQLDPNNNRQEIQSILHSTYNTDSKNFSNSRKGTARTRQKPNKRKFVSIPTTNLLQTLNNPTPNPMNNRSENLLDYSVARHLRLDQPCNLLTNVKESFSSTTTLTPITDIRYEIVDMFTKGTNVHLQQSQQTAQHQQPQISPLPSIASLMNRHASPIVSPTKQTIGINTDPLTTSTTNILHQPVATS